MLRIEGVYCSRKVCGDGRQNCVIDIGAVAEVPSAIQFTGLVDDALINGGGLKLRQEQKSRFLFNWPHEKNDLCPLHGAGPQLVPVLVPQLFEKVQCLAFTTQMPDEHVGIDKSFQCL